MCQNPLARFRFAPSNPIHPHVLSVIHYYAHQGLYPIQYFYSIRWVYNTNQVVYLIFVLIFPAYLPKFWWRWWVSNPRPKRLLSYRHQFLSRIIYSVGEPPKLIFKEIPATNVPRSQSESNGTVKLGVKVKPLATCQPKPTPTSEPENSVSSTS